MMRLSFQLPVAATLALCASTPGYAGIDLDQFKYDTLGRVVRVCKGRSNDGDITRYQYDRAGNRQSYSNGKTDFAIPSGSGIYSPDGRFFLVMQGDGNLVEYDTAANWYPVWYTGTNGSGAQTAYFQSDGNLVLYSANGTPVWASGTQNLCSTLDVGDDGNITIVSPDATAIWSSGIYLKSNFTIRAGSGICSADGRFLLAMQADGNLVEYMTGGSGQVPIWASNTAGSGAQYASMQGDGNFVLYGPNASFIWASNTANNPNATINIANDGNITINATTGAVVWSSNSGGH